MTGGCLVGNAQVPLVQQSLGQRQRRSMNSNTSLATNLAAGALPYSHSAAPRQGRSSQSFAGEWRFITQAPDVLRLTMAPQIGPVAAENKRIACKSSWAIRANPWTVIRVANHTGNAQQNPMTAAPHHHLARGRSNPSVMPAPKTSREVTSNRPSESCACRVESGGPTRQEEGHGD